MVMMGRVSGGVQGVRTNALVQPVDVMPTVLELAGLDAPALAH